MDKVLEEGLIKAALLGNLRTVKTLIEQGVSLDARSNEGGTPLHWAAAMGHFKVVKYLVEKGADVNARDNYGKTPLHWAMLGIEFRIRLLRASLNKMIEDIEKRTGKKISKSNMEEIERGLLTDEFYKSVDRDRRKIVRYLIKNGADPRAEDNDGNTPCDLAEDEKLKKIMGCK